MLAQYTTLTLFHFLLVFCRLGSVMMLFPGFGEIYVPPRVRLSIALAASAVVTPLLSPHLPPVPGNVIALGIMVLAEILAGVFIGGMARMVQAALHMAGMIIAFQSSLAAAMLFDVNQGSQGSMIGNFLTLIGVTMVFTSDMHHLMIAGIVDSYEIFAAGKAAAPEGFALLAVKTISGGFLVAVKIASPLLVIGLCLYLGAGIMSRLMPSMQVFFVMVPAQLYISFVLTALTLSAGMLLYREFFTATLAEFLTGL